VNLPTLGIIGAENSHVRQIAKLVNVHHIANFRVTHLWGEQPEWARDTALRGAIPEIVVDWKELFGKVDAVMVAHRDGTLHTEPADFFLRRGLPVFVDKPLAGDLATAAGLFDLAQASGARLLTAGILTGQKSFQDFARKVRAAGRVRDFEGSGHADVDSPYHGVFFYGFHQVDAAVELLGVRAETASLLRSGEGAVGSVTFSGGRMSAFHFLAAKKAPFHWKVRTDEGVFCAAHTNDEHMLLGCARLIEGLLAGADSSISRERMLAPIAILEALRNSLEAGRPVAVGSLTRR